MNLKSVKLDHNSYQEYRAGREVHCEAGMLSTKNVSKGEHVLVYKDSTAANTSASVPKREMQSEYIGIEGVVLDVNKEDEIEEVTIKKI